jgi:hypothetical protein
MSSPTRATPKHDIITIVRDPSHVLGKQFTWNTEKGQVEKFTAVSISTGIAEQRHVPDVTALKELLTQVAEERHAAIFNACIPMIEVGKPFLILSEREFEKRGVKRNDATVRWPVPIEYAGKEMRAVGRFKEHTSPSTWQLLDRDVDGHTPKQYADMEYDEWWAEVNKLLPGIQNCARLRAHSSSSRVRINGKPVGAGNGHTWVQFQNPDDVLRIRGAIKARAIDLDMVWKKPKRSRTSNDIVGFDLATIIDWSVFTVGRLVFVGKPEVNHAI